MMRARELGTLFLLAGLAASGRAVAQDAMEGPPHAADGDVMPPMEAPHAKPMMANVHLGGLKPFVGVTIRYDNIWTTDPNDVFFTPREQNISVVENAIIPESGEYIDGFRTKVRFGFKMADEDALVNGGVRVAVGQNPNPASSFVPLGEVFRPTGIGLDMYYLSISPLKGFHVDTDVQVRLDAGKIPNPFWRGEIKSSGFASEMIWDNDVNPAGVSGTVIIPLNDQVTLRNAASYYVIEDLEDRRFVGLTGEVNVIADQLLIETEWITGALAFYSFENLNSGLHAPGVTAPGNVSISPGSNAYLLGSGIQATNNRVNYGPGADGFRVERYRTLNLGIQAHPELELPELMVRPHFMIDAILNTTVKDQRVGLAVTAGAVFGDFDKSRVHPFDVWLTYRDVGNDATLAAIADSDLGRGTGYGGLEATVGYSFAKSLKLQTSYFDFNRWPQRANHDRRLFIDLIGKL
ncbi:MAG: putative porin [Myxococcota bacterium]